MAEENNKIELGDISFDEGAVEKAPIISIGSKLPKTDAEFEAEASEIILTKGNEDLNKQSEQREIDEAKKTEAIINVFDKNSVSSPEKEKYIADKKDIIKEKIKFENDEERKAHLQEILNALTQLGVEEYDYKPETKKNFKKIESEVKPVAESIENTSKDVSKPNKILSIFSKSESAKEEVKVEPKPVLPKGGSIKINLPDTLPLTNAEMDELHEKAITEHEEINKKTNGSTNVKVGKTQAEIKKEIQTQKDLDWRKNWQIKKTELMKNISERIPLEIETKTSVFLKSKEALIKELKNKKIVLDESVEKYLESDNFIIQNNNQTIKVIHITPDSAKVDEDNITMEQMYHISESLHLKPCSDDAVLGLILQLRERAPNLKTKEPNFNIFLNDGTVLNLKYDQKNKKMFVKFAMGVLGDSLCFFEIPSVETKE